MMNKIVEKAWLSENIYKMVVEAPLVAKKHSPGQFVILRINEEGERIPLTVTDVDREKGYITMIIQKVGYTTSMLANMDVGDELKDVVGPLGNPADIRHFGHVVVIGGGVGAGVAYPEARALKEAGNKITTILGARRANLLILEKELGEISDELIITTDDGSKGHHGVVTDILQKMIDNKVDIDLVIAIGPAIMMKFVAETTRPYGIKTTVSLNSIMVDGTGMCGSCRVSVGGQIKFVCADGPEFDAHQVNFDEFMSRLRIYTDEEKIAMEHHKGEEKCQ